MKECVCSFGNKPHVEEKALVQAFGSEYLDYCRATNRLIRILSGSTHGQQNEALQLEAGVGLRLMVTTHQ